MALISYDPFRALEDMQARIDELMNSSFGGSTTALTTPTADVYTEGEGDNKELIVEAHLPGYDKEEVNVDIENGTLTISAERSERQEDKKKRQYIVRESSSSFYRRVGLPKNVDSDSIKAHFDDGVLRITLPFKELPKPTRINIEKGKKSKK